MEPLFEDVPHVMSRDGSRRAREVSTSRGPRLCWKQVPTSMWAFAVKWLELSDSRNKLLASRMLGEDTTRVQKVRLNVLIVHNAIDCWGAPTNAYDITQVNTLPSPAPRRSSDHLHFAFNFHFTRGTSGCNSLRFFSGLC
jgi:hypothetical protein